MTGELYFRMRTHRRTVPQCKMQTKIHSTECSTLEFRFLDRTQKEQQGGKGGKVIKLYMISWRSFKHRSLSLRALCDCWCGGFAPGLHRRLYSCLKVPAERYRTRCHTSCKMDQVFWLVSCLPCQQKVMMNHIIDFPMVRFPYKPPFPPPLFTDFLSTSVEILRSVTVRVYCICLTVWFITVKSWSHVFQL